MEDIDNLQNLILASYIVLNGVEGLDWDYYENQRPLELVAQLFLN